MLRLSRRLLMLLVFPVLPCGPACAWDTSAWDAAPFDQRSGAGAQAGALIAGAIAQSQALRGGSKTSSNPQPAVTIGPSVCQVNIGGVVLGAGKSVRNSNVNVVTTESHSTNIVVCR